MLYYETPEIKILYFRAEDILAVSFDGEDGPNGIGGSTIGDYDGGW